MTNKKILNSIRSDVFEHNIDYRKKNITILKLLYKYFNEHEERPEYGTNPETGKSIDPTKEVEIIIKEITQNVFDSFVNHFADELELANTVKTLMTIYKESMWTSKYSGITEPRAKPTVHPIRNKNSKEEIRVFTFSKKDEEEFKKILEKIEKNEK